MADLRELLLIAYHFPPIGGSGVQRVLKLARYLPRFGWRAHVVCCGHTHYPLIDDTLACEAGPHTTIHHTRGMEPGGLAASLGQQVGATWGGAGVARRLEDGLSWRLEKVLTRAPLPEHELLWVPAAAQQARRIAQRHPIEAVLTSGPPHCTHWVGETLKRRLGLPWIADLRDPILDNWARQRESRWRNRYWRWMERAVIGRADQLVVTCPEVKESLASRYPALRMECVEYIPNGFDPEDAPTARETEDDCTTSRSAQRSGVFKLAYIGAFYRDQSIGPILQAIRLVRSRNVEAAQRLRFRLIGSLSAPQRMLICSEDSAFLDHIGYLPHCDAVEEMIGADVLMLMTPSNAAGRYCIPAKTFEYLAFGRHILAIVHPDTNLARTLLDAGNTTIVQDRDVEKLAGSIERCFDAWRRGELQRPRIAAVVNQFRRDRQVRDFARLIEQCADQRPKLRVVNFDGAEEEVAV